MSRTPLVLSILLIIILLSGCTSLDTLRFSAEASLDAMKSSMDKKLKAEPASGAGYVPMQQLAKNPKLPFDKAWIKQGVDWQRYRTIYIAPVNTDYLMRGNWWQESIRSDQIQQDVQNMAIFMRTQFITAFQNDPHRRLRVVMSPEKGSLTLAMAITELVPSKVLLNIIKVAGPYGSGLVAAALERGAEAQSTVAFEGPGQGHRYRPDRGHVRRPAVCYRTPHRSQGVHLVRQRRRHSQGVGRRVCGDRQLAAGRVHQACQYVLFETLVIDLRRTVTLEENESQETG